MLFIGLGMTAVGVVLLRRQYTSGSGLGRGKLVTKLVDPAPVVGRTTSKGMTVEHRRSANMSIEQRVRTIQDMVWKSVQVPEMRKLALQLTRKCPERDELCETKAIYDAVRARVRYNGDVAPVKMGADGPVEAIDMYHRADRTWEFGAADCLPKGTLLLTEGHKFVAIEDLIIGQRIWGKDDWTEVKDVWFKGTLPVTAVHLNNGSTFKATEDHKVYVALCPSHPIKWGSSGKSCSCALDKRSIERIKVSQLEPGMVLVQPEKIAFGTEEQDPRRALIEGLYISDGWSDAHAFDISGLDGHPKEAQKREVEEICAALGVPTTWARKSIAVRDAEWAKRMALMGTKAWNKHALSINLTEAAAGELLRGIMADSGANTSGNGRTFTTTSRELMLQTRVLHRMFGRSCGERYIVDHGGLGEHPIHRLQVRMPDVQKDKLLRVKEIDRNIVEAPVYDISTSDHYVYLPEADVTVSNCDDQAILNATLLVLNGIPARLRVTAEPGAADFGHIYTVAMLPKMNPSKTYALDTTLPGNKNFNREVPYGKSLDFPV